MATYKYTGEDERVFPTIGVIVESGNTFEAPDDFSAYNVLPVSGNSKPSAPAKEPKVDQITTPSAATDLTAGA
jgi:hypothetical protein